MKKLTVATQNLRHGAGGWGVSAPLLMEQPLELKLDASGLQEVSIRLD